MPLLEAGITSTLNDLNPKVGKRKKFPFELVGTFVKHFRGGRDPYYKRDGKKFIGRHRPL